MMGAMYYLGGSIDLESFMLQTDYGQLAVLLLLPLGIHVLFMAMNDATLGMYALDLQILQDDASIPQLSNLVRRPIGLLALPASGMLSLLVPLLNDHRRSVGDYFSGTRVVESLALGQRISYDPWRIFKSVLRPAAPICFALAIGLMLVNEKGGRNKDIVLDALVVAGTATMVITMLFATIKVKISKVRFAPRGIQRSGWFGWSHHLVKWEDIEYTRVRPQRLFSYFEVNKVDRRRFNVPLEKNSAQFTAQAFLSNGVRIEQ